MSTPNNTIAFTPIAVQPLAFVSSLGTSLTEIYNNTQAPPNPPSRLETEIFDVSTQSMSKVYGVMVLADSASYVERLNKLINTSITQAALAFKKYSPTFTNIASQLFILIQLPAVNTRRAKFIDQSALATIIRNSEISWSVATIKFIDTDDAISIASQLLQQSTEITAVIVGAVDSLFDDDAISFLADSNELRTMDDSNGVAIGEAAGWLLLTRDGKNAPLILKHHAIANDKHCLVTATEKLQLKQRINKVIKLYSNTPEHLNQEHEINLRFLEVKLASIPDEHQIQLIDLTASCGYLGSANSAIALAYLAGSHAADPDAWNAALILNHDLELQTAHSYLITKGNVYEHDHA